ncbi:MAG: AAA family ATPase [Candidatus Korarchaeota archaeon]|nr:AAA family ATPase [Candidatus Korarchaeota archaeon]NIU84166.1 AAA family ATPase [Candidatus Thorarchaeota archaeon]NIW14311.1 AAA family ATPase [Candidatus Thorarchaeota archaeon]NIW52408.1 AAA family ATPase [Candidatus Korarchaeota archaeon]
MIQEVEASNFMSYDHFHINLDEGINLLVGEKGSGKTSILEAIRLAFGGLGRERQDVLADFIKEGRKEAKIKVTLSNATSTSGQTIKLIPSLPKDASVVIERELHRNRASMYKINGQRTRKYTLIDTLARIGVTPENKLFFLPQEEVNEWVNIGSDKRLEMFLRALGLLELKQKIDRLREDIREKKKERKEYLEIVNKWEKRAEEKKDKILPPEVAKKTMERFYTFKLAKLIHEKDELERKIESKRTSIKEMKNEVAQLEEDIEQLKERKKEIERERKETSRQWQNLMVEKKPKFSDQKNKLERNIKEKQAELENISVKYRKKFFEIREIRQKWHVKNVEELQSLIDEKKKDIDEIEEKLLMDSEYRRIKEMENEADALKRKRQQLNSERKRQKKKLDSLLHKTSISALPKIYPRLLEEGLIRREGTFKRIFGPLCLEIEVALPMNEAKEYSFALENGLGDLAFSFLTLDPKHYERLRDFCRRIKNGHKITIHEVTPEKKTEKALNQIIHRGKRRRSELKEKGKKTLGMYAGSIVAWLPEIIDAPKPVKAIIEALNWNVPIVTEISVAKEIIRELGVNKAVTLDGEVIEEIPSENQDTKILKRTPPSLESKEDSIIEEGLGFTLSSYLRGNEKIKQKVETVTERIHEKERNIQKYREELPRAVKKLFERQTGLEEQITELKQEQNALQRLKRQREKELDRREDLKQVIKDMREQIDSIADKLAEMDKKIEKLREKEERLVEKKRELTETREKKFAKLERLKGKIEDAPLLLKVLQKERQSKEEQIADTKREIIAFMKMLKRFGIYSEESVNSLLEKQILTPLKDIEDMELETIKEVLNRLEEYSEDYRQAIQETEEKMEEVNRMKEKAEEYRKKIKKVEREKDEIEKLCNEESQELLEEIKEKTETINRNYQRILGYLNAKGAISVEGTKVGRLNLKTTIDLHRDQPMDVSAGGFSSGEKTIAIMSMIIAILLTSPAPVYIWDEFEVFLDIKSLYSVITLIKNALESHQGILTTTHRDELIRAGDKVFFTKYNEEKRDSTIIPLTNKAARRVERTEKFGAKWL